MADGEKKRVAEKKSLSIRTVTLLTLIAACVLAAASILFIRRTEQTNRAMRRADENYIVCSQTADELMDASDYLTEMVRTFAITGDETDPGKPVRRNADVQLSAQRAGALQRADGE